MAHVVGQVALFRPRGDVGREAEQGVVHGQAVVMCGWMEEGGRQSVFQPLLANRTNRQKGKACVLVWGDARILSEELSVWAGELDTLLLRWDDGWLPGLRWSSKDGAGEGLSGTRSCNPSNNKSTHTQNKYPVENLQLERTLAVLACLHVNG